jgi:hypothetical protein
VGTDPNSTAAQAATAWTTLEEYLHKFDKTFGGEGALGSTTAGDELVVAKASLALHVNEPARALEVLRPHNFVHYGHGPRPSLFDLWLRAQVHGSLLYFLHPSCSRCAIFS